MLTAKKNHRENTEVELCAPKPKGFSIVDSMPGEAYENGYRALVEDAPVVVGMPERKNALRNSVIKKMVFFSSGRFSQVNVFTNDNAEHHSDRKQPKRSNINSVNWKRDIKNNLAFLRTYSKLKEMYKSNSFFFESVNAAARADVNASGCGGFGHGPKLNKAIGVLLKQLAFLEAAPNILKVDRVAFVLTKPSELFELFISGEFDHKDRKKTGLILIQPVP